MHSSCAGLVSHKKEKQKSKVTEYSRNWKKLHLQQYKQPCLCANFTLHVDLSPIVQRADNAIQWISVNKTYCSIHQIEIYPVDSIVHPSTNQGQ